MKYTEGAHEVEEKSRGERERDRESEGGERERAGEREGREKKNINDREKVPLKHCLPVHSRRVPFYFSVFSALTHSV